jgi:hypothetical protein
MYEPFDEDRVRLILLEEIYYLMRAVDGRLRDTSKEAGQPVAAAVIAAVGEAAKERMAALRAGRSAG